jgi:uncharacterized protein (DUF1330 family)
MVYLIIQGKLKENSETIYTEYLNGVSPLMKEFGVEIVAVGAGFTSEFITDDFSTNAILSVPDEETLNKFLGDPRYFAIKKFRDQAYETLHLSVFNGREARKVD